MNNITELGKYRELQHCKTLFDVTLGKFSDRRIALTFDGSYESVTMDRENFEKMVKNARSIMGWAEDFQR